jgi:hypothetical protein
MPIVTSINVIIRPRRLRNSMNRVVIIAKVGTGEPRRSGGVGWFDDALGTTADGTVVIVLPPACW